MLAAGQSLSARFILVRLLGAGGRGSVWLARDEERGEPVAVKLLPEDLTGGLTGNAAAAAALQRECERARALEHPGILRIHGLHRSATHAWIAMEYAPGGDATGLRGRPAIEVIPVLLQVAGALAHAHGRGVVHRDVKASNVLLMADGSARLADFGLAHWIDRGVEGGSDAVLAAEREDVARWPGSPYGVSPQQLAGEPAVPADDVYAFGAMLYELLSGYPPLYPDITPARVRTERPASLATRCNAPSVLVDLADRCLEKLPEHRPGSMQVVQRTLAAALEQLSPPMSTSPIMEPPKITPPTGRGEGLRGEWRRSDGSHAAGGREEELRRQGFRRGLVAAALILAVIGLGLVFFALPQWVSQPAQNAAPAAQQPAPATPAPPEEEVDLAALARARLEAEELRAALDPRIVKLRERAGEAWGGEDFARANAELASGDEKFAAREYFEAVEHYTAAQPLIEALEERMAAALKEALDAGALALREGRSSDAADAFELAGRIEPGNRTAGAGLKRAQTLDQVLALVASAERLEQQGDVSGAAAKYREALELDSAAPRASEGLARVNARIAGDAFASAMARGFQALASGDYGEARQAFQAAGRVRPSAPEVAQALKQVEQEERTRIIAAKLGDAREMEAGERWAEALKVYRAVLELDSTVVAATQGVARVGPRAELHEQLDLYMTQPERLFSTPVRRAAYEALQRARAIPEPGPVLERQMATVSDWLARAEKPVQVALQSDNVTQVTIYRVGELGTFEQRSLELQPGSYTVVGTRPGYRDVRREITVLPGESMPPVVIRCEDKI